MQAIKDIFARQYAQEANLCFVLMPFKQHLDEIYTKVIKPTAETICKMKCVRADEIYSSKSVMGDVWEYIQKADIVIADLTERNPNVLYELGLCHASWKRTILLAQRIEEVPFDLQQFRFILYEQSLSGAEKLAQALSKAVSQIRAETVKEGHGVEITFPVEGQPIYGDFTAKGRFKNRPRVRRRRVLWFD